MIKIRIHRKELERLGACTGPNSGMALFETLQKRGIFRSNWTCPKCKELESSSVGYNDRGDPIYRAPLGRMQSEDEQ